MKKKKFTIIGPDTEADILVNEDEMIVYDVCKIKDYEGTDYVPRKARKMGNVVRPIGHQDFPGDDKSDPDPLDSGLHHCP